MSTAADVGATPSRSPGEQGITTTQPGGPLKAAKTPVGPGAVTYVGALIALAVIGLGVVGLQTGAAAAGLIKSRPWLTQAVHATQGLRPLSWAVPVALLAVVFGLWLIMTAMLPRPKTALALDARTGVFLRPRDLAQLAQDAADDIDGVAGVKARAARGRITLAVQSTGGAPVGQAVEQVVSRRLAPLKGQVRVSVKTKKVAL